MKLTFHGGAGEVTGSCILVEVGSASLLVDCGMFQGGASTEAKNRRPFRFDASAVEAVLLTHAHLDHCGRLPLLVKAGFEGPIYATAATRDLAELILMDSAKIQQADLERVARRRRRIGRGAAAPLYTSEDVERTMRRFELVEYGRAVNPTPGATARFHDAGHILGSASLRLVEDDTGEAVVFSGDVGQKDAALLRDPVVPEAAPLLVLESTYGDRNHRSHDATLEEFKQIISAAVENREKVLIPAFAVGRTQEIIYHLGRMIRDGELPRVPVYVDSPMAIDATEIHRRHRSSFDDEAWAEIERDESPLSYPSLRLLRKAADSRKLNESWECAIIIAGAGMCTGGRILHHFKHNLWRRNVSVVIAGFQARGTLGRALVDGAERVRIFGEPILVRATIHTLGGFSAHAGRSELMQWARRAAAPGGRIALNHGETEASQSLAEALRAGGFDTMIAGERMTVSVSSKAGE